MSSWLTRFFGDKNSQPDGHEAADGPALADDDIGKTSNMPPMEEADLPFYLLPSVGTWLQPRRIVSWTSPADATAVLECKAESLRPCAVDAKVLDCPAELALGEALPPCQEAAPRPAPAFAMLPSVGSWLQHRHAEPGEAASWHADFAAFAALAAQPEGQEVLTACGSSPFTSVRLAPPPSPAMNISVGSPAPGAEVEVVVLESEEPRKDSPTKEACLPPLSNEQLVGPCTADDDDEELLLGCEALDPKAASKARAKAAPNGVDSPSESDGEGAAAPGIAQQTAAPRQPGADLTRTRTAILEQEPPADQNQASITRKRTAMLSGEDMRPCLLVPEEPEALGSEGAPPAASGAGAAEAVSFQEPILATPPVARAPEAKAPPSAGHPSMRDIDLMVGASLDKFFGDETTWKQVGREVASSTKPVKRTQAQGALAKFRVQVPKPYPGVQYRKSKSLDDRYPRFAENDTTVEGHVEDDGEWLRIGQQIYLPMRVGAVRILEPLPPEGREATRDKSRVENNFGWWACCSGEAADGPQDEVIVGRDPPRSEARGGHAQLPPTDVIQDRAPRLGGAVSSGMPPPPPPVALAPRGQPSAAASPAMASADEREAEEGAASDVPRPTALPEEVSKNPLSNVSSVAAANRHFNQPINPFADTHSPTKRRSEQRLAGEEEERPAGSRRADPTKEVFQA